MTDFVNLVNSDERDMLAATYPLAVLHDKEQGNGEEKGGEQ